MKQSSHVNSQDLWQHAQNLSKLKPDQMSAFRGELSKQSHLYPYLLAIISCWKREKVFIKSVSWLISRKRPHIKKYLRSKNWYWSTLKRGHDFVWIWMEGVSSMNDSEIKYDWNILYQILEAFLKKQKMKVAEWEPVTITWKCKLT